MSAGRRILNAEFAVALAVLLAATLAVTWPLGLHLADRLSGNWDSFFGAWRLAWIADAAVSRDLHLFDAPIFFPELRTLAFSDAILLPGLAAAPLRYLGLSALTAYNLALFAAFVSSGLAMFVLVRHLSGRADAALIAAVTYTLAPYRLDHLDHFEMQMAMWMPLALWLWHRAADGGAPRLAAGAVGAAVLQWLSCIYYGLLFAPVFAIGILVEWGGVAKGRRARMAGALVAAGIAGAIVIALYSLPYLANRGQTGDRLPEDVARYSATFGSYVAVHPHNAIYGRLLTASGEFETRLFPGSLAIIFAAAGLAFGPWNRRRWAHLAMALLAIDLSLGTNGLVFPILREFVVPYRGLRAPARAGVMVLLVISVLVGAGAAAMLSRLKDRRAAAMVTAVCLLVLVVEYRNAPDLWEVTTSPSVPQLGLTRGSVVLEMPIATPERLDQSVDADYMLARVGAWPSLVNGYSGYYPPDYLTMADRIRLFPDDRAIREIARIGVTVLTVHERWYGPRYQEIVAALDARADVEPIGSYTVNRKEVAVYHVKPFGGG
ncbi:MAG: hypothetical protein ABI665_02605 [Vicinamibacterales bacterium]